MNILIFGSSITWGAWDIEGGWAQRLKSFCDNKAIATNFEMYNAVYCLGISGDKSTDLLERFESEIKARIDEDEKTLILVEIGINDSQFLLKENKHRVSPEEYKENIIRLIEITKELHVDLIFIGLTPVDKRVDPTPWTPGKTYRLEFIKQYDEILRNVSEEYNIPHIKLIIKFPKDEYQNLLNDGLHPSTAGHKIMYEEVKKYLTEQGLI